MEDKRFLDWFWKNWVLGQIGSKMFKLPFINFSSNPFFSSSCSEFLFWTFPLPLRFLLLRCRLSSPSVNVASPFAVFVGTQKSILWQLEPLFVVVENWSSSIFVGTSELSCGSRNLFAAFSSPILDRWFPLVCTLYIYI